MQQKHSKAGRRTSFQICKLSSKTQHVGSQLFTSRQKVILDATKHTQVEQGIHHEVDVEKI